jgi:hypothetical protein
MAYDASTSSFEVIQDGRVINIFETVTAHVSTLVNGYSSNIHDLRQATGPFTIHHSTNDNEFEKQKMLT